MRANLIAKFLLLLLSLYSSNGFANNSDYEQFFDYVLQEIQGKTAAAKAITVSRIINEFQYIDDQAGYNSKDYWAKPDEFLARKGGDCEDFAIFKYTLLQSLGIDSSLVQFRKGDENHIAVAAISDKKILLLDIDNLEYPLSSASVKKYRFFRLHKTGMNQQTAFNRTPLIKIKNGLPSL